MLKLNQFLIVLALGVTGFLGAKVFRPALGVEPQVEAHPKLIGRVGSIDLEVLVGDIAIPNRLMPAGRKAYRLDQRLRFWDSLLISAPVPDVFSTPEGVVLTIPWTRLPGSVTERVFQIDEEFGEELARWLGLKTQGASRSFRRLERLEIPRHHAYYEVTELKSIYAVNLFEFLEELGPRYQENMASAVSSATKEAVEFAGSSGDSRLAIPALAAAGDVVDQHLVIEYQESFAAILDGISRAKGNTPSSVVLVVWNALRNRPQEFAAAWSGLEHAALKAVPAWASKLRTMASITLGSCIVVGVVIAHFETQTARPTIALGIGALAFLATALDNMYVTAAVGLLPLTPYPDIEFAVLASTGGFVGIVLHRLGAAGVGGDNGTKASDGVIG